MAAEKPWGKPAEGPTFNEKYPTEFRPSAIPDAGNGWWAKVDIPRGTRLRRVSVADGSLIRVGSLEELKAAGWEIDDSVNYGVGHKEDPDAIYFLNPGTACNHADPTREVSIIYKHDEKDVFELWTTKDIKAGDEMFIHYSQTFGACKWFDELQNSRGNTPLSQLGTIIDHMVLKLKPAPKGAVEMKVSLKKSKVFYINAALGFLKGLEAKPATEDKEALEAKPAVDNLRISGVGEACSVAIAAATQVAADGVGTLSAIQTSYPKISGSQCPQILIDIKKN
jgi:hypothetical protein